jgi:hypothetical protein
MISFMLNTTQYRQGEERVNAATHDFGSLKGKGMATVLKQPVTQLWG